MDIAFGEVVNEADAVIPGNYVASGGQTAIDARVMWPGDMVQVSFDAPVVPGADTLDVQNVFDLAGNQMTIVLAQAVATADVTAPAVATATADAVSGYFNDQLTVDFDEPVLPQEAGNLANFALESPTGTPISMAGASIVYDEDLFRATITLAGALNLDNGLTCTITATGIRDVAGNSIGVGGVFAGFVGGDATAPSVLSITQNTMVDPFGQTVDVLFNEPVDLTGSAAPAASADGGQVLVDAFSIEGSTMIRVVFDAVVVPGTTTVSVSGVEDPASNVGGLFAILTATPDASAPGISSSSATTIVGSGDDLLTLTFNEPVMQADAETPANWVLESPTGIPFSLAGASFEYDPVSRMASIELPEGSDMDTGLTFTLLVSGVRDVAGNSIGVSVPSAGTVVGDAAAPSVIVADRNEVADPGDRTVDVSFSEELNPAAAETAGNYTLTGVGAPLVISATLLLDGSTVRLYLDAAVIPGTHALDVSNIDDPALNMLVLLTGQPITP